MKTYLNGNLYKMTIYDEISLFFDEPIEQVKYKCSQAHYRLHRSWKEMSPQSEKHRNYWYRTTDSQIYEQANWHQQQYSLRRNLARKSKGKILIFGSGIGTEGIIAAQLGKQVTFYDLQGLTYDFLKFRVKRHKLKNVTFIDQEIIYHPGHASYYSGQGFVMYDTIICLDVLEHVQHPQEMLNFLAKHLNSNGNFYVSAPFQATEYLSHLSQNSNLKLNTMLKKAKIKHYEANVLFSSEERITTLTKFVMMFNELWWNIRFVVGK